MLPTHLPTDPLPLFIDWYENAQRNVATDNPNAMVLGSVDASVTPARPSARVVLCKAIIADPGFIVFYTNYQSRKSQELLANGFASAVFFWDSLGRQIRIGGPVSQSPAAESDAYFATRGIGSRIGAWASMQSAPIDSRAALVAQVAEQAKRFGATIDEGTTRGDPQGVPRPPHWGGFRIWIAELELWNNGEHRVHDRARWTRDVTLDGESATVGAWQHSRLQP